MMRSRQAFRTVPLLLVAALTTVWPAAAQPAPPADPEAVIRQAEDLHLKSKFRDAETSLTSLLKRTDLTSSARARALIRLAWAKTELGRYEQSLRLLDEADALAREVGDARTLHELEFGRGSAWRFRAAPLRAIDHYGRALAIAERAGLGPQRARTLGVLANTYQQLGDWGRTLDYAERAFAADPNPTDARRFSYLINRGIAYYEFHDREQAEQSFQRALELARRMGHPRSESFALGELGLVAWSMDRDYTRALDLFDRALTIATQIEVRQLQIIWLNNAGGVLRDSGRLEAALERYRAAAALDEPQGGTMPSLAKNTGQVLLALGRPDEALPLLLDAVRRADAQGDERIRWQARMELGTLYRERDPAQAARYFGESLDVLEAHHATALLEGFRAGVLSSSLGRYDPYDRYIRFLLDRDERDAAFAIAERARARVFLDTLMAARTELSPAVPADYAREEADLIQRISTLQSELRSADLPGARRRAVSADVEAAEGALSRLRLRLALERPSLAHARFPRVWSLEEARAELLHPGETLVMFFLGREASVAWIVDRRRAEAVRLPPAADIDGHVGRLLATLRSPATPVDAEARAWLSQQLVAPIVARAPRDTRLVIVPHGSLHYLPFETLADDDGGYLVERNAISYAPSVSSLAFLRQRSTQSMRGQTVLAVGGPAMAGLRAAERASPIEWVGLLKPLPHTVRELRSISGIFQPHGRVLEGEAATEEALGTAAVRGVGILHFATHALVDEGRPERSGLALSQGRGGSDGILQTREIYRLDLDAALVTLSACQTALGRDVTGEGLVGLSRAFFYAGANAVAASLWSVNDASTADLMGGFYRNLRDGSPIDRAMADAKRAFVAGGRFSHPYYWAPFVVTGSARDPVAVAAPARSLALPVLAATAGALTMMALFMVVAPGRRRSASASA
jgi:CHAT domain-containing protein/Tfp pilus assembly protein PilF